VSAASSKSDDDDDDDDDDDVDSINTFFDFFEFRVRCTRGGDTDNDGARARCDIDVADRVTRRFGDFGGARGSDASAQQCT
jgi:hypothetical protein